MRWPAKWRPLTAVLAAAALGVPAPAAADLWDQLVQGSVTPQQIQTFSGDRSGITWRGGLGLGLPSPGGGRALELEVAGPRGCAAADFVGQFQAMFSAQALEDYFTGLLDAAIASAPLVLMCYASPTLCDAYKHFKSIASQVLELRAGECRAIEQAALGIGDKVRAQREQACIEEKVTAGTPVHVALDECRTEARQSILNFALQPVERLDLVEEALRVVGAEPEQKQLARALLGEVRFRGGTWQTELPPPEAAEARWGEAYAQYLERIQAVLATVAGGGIPSPEAIQGVSLPGVPIGVPVFQRLASLPAAERQLGAQKLAAALALARIEYQLNVLAAELRRPGGSPAGSRAQAVLEARVQALEEARARFRALKANADSVAETVSAIDAAARAHERRAWQATQPAFSPAPPAVAAPGRPPRLGGGLELSP